MRKALRPGAMGGSGGSGWGGAGVGSPEPGSTSLIVLDYGFGFDSTWDG